MLLDTELEIFVEACSLDSELETSQPIFPAEDKNLNDFLETLNPDQKKYLKNLTFFGISWEEIQIGMQHPHFIKQCAMILNPTFKGTLQEKAAAIKKLVAEIAKWKAKEEEKEPKEEEKTKKERQSINLNTLRRYSVLASLYKEGNGSTLEEILQSSFLQKRALRSALWDFEKEGYIQVNKTGKCYLYYITHCGINNLISFMVQEFPCDKDEILKISHNTSCTFPGAKMLSSLKKAILITQTLRGLGWYHRCIKQAFHKNKLSYILSMIESTAKNPAIKNLGAYLYTILIKGVSKAKRKAALIEKTLSSVPENLVNIYKEESKGMTMRQAIHFAFALKRMYQKSLKKGETLFPGRIEILANWVRKRSSYMS